MFDDNDDYDWDLDDSAAAGHWTESAVHRGAGIVEQQRRAHRRPGSRDGAQRLRRPSGAQRDRIAGRHGHDPPQPAGAAALSGRHHFVGHGRRIGAQSVEPVDLWPERGAQPVDGVVHGRTRPHAHCQTGRRGYPPQSRRLRQGHAHPFPQLGRRQQRLEVLHHNSLYSTLLSGTVDAA